MASKTKKSEQTELKEQIEKTAKMFDVAQPGKTAPAPTSRPIIVGHSGGMKRDPMVVDPAPEDQPKEEAVAKPEESKPDAEVDSDQPTLAVKTKVIKPLSVPDKPAEKTEPETVPEPAVEKAAGIEEEPKTGAMNTLMNQMDAKQADKKQKNDLEIKAKEVDSLIASQKYFVPIGLESRRKSHYRVVVFLVMLLILVVAGLNFAIDAEVLDVGVEALTNIL